MSMGSGRWIVVEQMTSESKKRKARSTEPNADLHSEQVGDAKLSMSAGREQLEDAETKVVELKTRLTRAHHLLHTRLQEALPFFHRGVDGVGGILAMISTYAQGTPFHVFN